MKKVLCTLLSSALVLTSMALCTSAEENTAEETAADGRTIVHAGEGKDIKLDGVREDCYGTPVKVARAGVSHNPDRPLTTASLSVAWEGDTIYYYIEVADTTPNAVSSQFWQCDGVEFVADLLNAKPLTYPTDNTVARFAILPAVDDANPYFLFPYMLSYVNADQVEWYFSPVDEWEDNGGYVLECSFKSPVPLEKGQIIGFDVQIYDDQLGNGARDSQTYLADTRDTFHYCPADLGAYLVLGMDAEVTVEESAPLADERVAVNTGYGAAVVDGEKDDCYGETVKIEKAGISHPAENQLTTADIAFSWAGDKIYAYAEITDTTPNAVSGNFWQCDGLELVYDLLDARATSYPSDNSVARFAVLPVNTAESTYASNYFLANAAEEQINYSYKTTDTGYVLEIEYTVPASVSGCLKSGASVGFDAQIYDDQTGSGNRDSQTFFGNTDDVIGSNPVLFGGKLILAEAVDTPVPEVVEAQENASEPEPTNDAVSAPIEKTEAPAAYTAPQTFDVGVVGAVTALISLLGYTVTKRK